MPHEQGGGYARGTGAAAPEFVRLPVTEADPTERLLEVGRRTRDRRLRLDWEETRRIEDALAHLPHALAALANDHLLQAPSRYNVGVTNVPGPPMTLYVAGSRIRSAVPLPHLYGHHLLHVAIVSLSGELTIGLVVDPEHFPDPQGLARATDAELVALLERASRQVR